MEVVELDVVVADVDDDVTVDVVFVTLVNVLEVIDVVLREELVFVVIVMVVDVIVCEALDVELEEDAELVED